MRDLVQSSDGKWSYHGLAADEAWLTFYNDVWRVYRPDGLYAKEVFIHRVEDVALKFITNSGWKARR